MAPPSLPRTVFLLLALPLAALLVACGERPEPSPATASAPAARIVVLGFDGLEPTVVDSLVAEGKLPHFQKLREGGASGPLTSAHPLMSPVIWTTLGTGRKPVDHGVTDFVVRSPTTGEELPVTRRQRRVRAIWNLFSEAGKTVGVVGWWATWPAEAVRGTMVSDRVAYHFLQGAGDREELPGVTYPPEALEEIRPLIRRPEEIGGLELRAFADLAPEELEHGFTFGDEVSHLRWAIAAARTHSSIGLHLLETERPDLLMVYVEATDTIAHLFGHLYRHQDLAGELAEQARRFGGAVEAVYRLADEILGSYLEQLTRGDVLMVISDHGFELGSLLPDPSKARDLRRVSHEFHKLDGCIFVYGAGVRPGARIEGASIYDVAPTLLALGGLPASKEMSGRVLAGAFEGGLEEGPRIATYEAGPVFQDETASGEGEEAVDQAVLEKLRSLGYIGGGDEPQASPMSRNEAAFAMQEGRYREAAQAYHRLLQADPDNAALHTDLASALLSLGREEEASESLARALELAPAYPPAYFFRGRLNERRGEKESAVRDYRDAARFDESYRAPREALERLGEPVARVARTPQEVESALLLQNARAAARRGDYNEALEDLDRAERLTPDASVVYQYRANIAYLQGDLEAAEAALVKALELEPDNPQLKENLRRIREKG
ncbi:MAG: alkaline phosphatase family protein [Acidobacteria bacterium]|nr:alkaline phosphatase family protein [Acidobacteriota bacterium]